MRGEACKYSHLSGKDHELMCGVLGLPLDLHMEAHSSQMYESGILGSCLGWRYKYDI